MKIRIKLGKKGPYSEDPSLFIGFARYPGNMYWQPAELQQWDENTGNWSPIEIVDADESN